jgi:hypothetical protein
LDRNDPPTHRLLGHPNVVQDSSFQPDTCRDAVGGDRWLLLAQFDGWGDCGRVFYWIRPDELAAGRFDHTWVIAQSH